jgi:hypothetical protein
MVRRKRPNSAANGRWQLRTYSAAYLVLRPLCPPAVVDIDDDAVAIWVITAAAPGRQATNSATSSKGRFIQAVISSSTWSVILEIVSRDTLAPYRPVNPLCEGRLRRRRWVFRRCW